ncbi:hypothetical protein CC86DRAFT_392760 [Ophiobolus disseminans]|uniref:Uncharacterized protein n=1 Tax=Ophiobolus disseminans TaxID=1469910 RepID=A0A6A7A5A5_9PLEO|nr:hypothetical protein CC86DRAFT_392760 [Ophiobolus disseminans]
MAAFQPFQSKPRFLLPCDPLLLRPQTRVLLQHASGLRHATTPAKGLSTEFLRRKAAQQQKVAPHMATKKYPNMMITLSIAAWYVDFLSRTIYTELLPTRKDFVRHPYKTTKRFIEVYKMHMEYTLQLYTQQRLKKAVEDSRYYVGEDGVRRRRVKRWFGIWE